jgi:MinD superfamily P-loop ATPase
LVKLFLEGYVKQIAVLSGKGGTGKTSIVASFAALAKNKVIADCDVDAPDLHLILKPEIKERQKFKGSKTAVIDMDRCTECEICEEVCEFDAIHDLKIDKILCEGCGVCVYSCPADAITLEENISGYAFVSDTKYGPMSHAELNIAEEASGKLVTLVRNNAIEIARREKKDLILIDGPPGIGCPVIASLTEVDSALIVSEPTVSGLHDLDRILELVSHFGIKPFVCINKYDISMENTKKIEEFCKEVGVEIIGRISYDPIVTNAMVAGKSVVEFDKGKVTGEIKEIWEILGG